jgi:hypothetical protein
MVIVYGDKNMCNCFAIKTSKWTTPCHVLSKKTKIVAHGKFIDFHSSNMDEKNSTKMELPYN